ncbi:MAG TPA: Bax inhibitor-1 family protein [Burkholderiales bacterium]|nr:Bax inhibitor-1 family protein [Burkholderiales bacterium]
MQPELQTVDAGYGSIAATPDSQKVLRNTYMLLALTMVPTVLGAFIGIQMAPAMMASPIMTTVLMLASVIGLQFAIIRYRDSGVGVALLLLMTFLLGAFLGPLLNVALQLKNGIQLVGYAATGTGVIFFGMGALASTIKRDLSFMGKFLFVGMIAVVVAGIANMFLQIPLFGLVISTLVLVIFSLYLLYDLNRIIRGGETNYVMATTGVYLSLLNIFTSLLQILMSLSGDRD